MRLVLVADPMCSWCYGFGKEMTALQERHPEMTLEIVVGGLRAGGTEVLDDAGKRFRLEHWAKVEELSGLPFNRQGLVDRKGFVYDTEPVCRAVVAARIMVPEADLLKVFRAFQHAFYVDALDTTDGTVLANVGASTLTAMGYPLTADAFKAVWLKQSTIQAASNDFAKARAIGVSSFPSLFLEKDGALHKIGNGYAQVAAVERELSALVAAV
jgi:putative protein-disulfide isomerase